MTKIQHSYNNTIDDTASLQTQYVYISLFSFPIVVLFVKFFSEVWTSHMAFSYKLVAIFLVFIFISNFFSKLTIKILSAA